MKPKKCKVCKKPFVPKRPLQFLCGIGCATEYAYKAHKKSTEKKQREKIKEMKEGLLTRTDYLNLLQITFNTYIRQRDKNQLCISCNKPFTFVNKITAGHFFSVGSYPNLRFNENNIFGQCNHCNLFLHSNPIEYRLGIEKRIGKKKVAELYADRDKPLKLSIDEIKAMIVLYKQKIKKLQDAN